MYSDWSVVTRDFLTVFKMEKIIFFVVCSLAVFEGYVADAQLNIDTVNPTDEIPITERAELQIINLCTEVPSMYEQLVESFNGESSSPMPDPQQLQQFEDKLKAKTEELRQYVSKYDQSVSATDPDAQTMQNLMSSAVDELVQSITKINDDFNTEITQTSESVAAGVDKRPELMQQYVRPAMVKFEEFCLLQTKDILKNILQDYEATLLS
ncbi:uncharacterized protein LOC135848170 [Planococcus citri]|uniref:uncharacterized protein LOC135848170 n=1 Tax=Planococcus citri TaxID=170843 RepID=UPI0031F8B5D1